jgi:hypothetical protein
MIMSRQASRLAGDAGTVVPDASRHRLFTAGGHAPGAGGAPPALAARSGACDGVPPLRRFRCRASHGRQPDSRREPAGMEGTAK